MAKVYVVPSMKGWVVEGGFSRNFGDERYITSTKGVPFVEVEGSALAPLKPSEVAKILLDMTIEGLDLSAESFYNSLDAEIRTAVEFAILAKVRKNPTASIMSAALWLLTDRRVVDALCYTEVTVDDYFDLFGEEEEEI